MKKTNRKGFTIVELVIVIAVIAVLAAVLIPTFSSIVNKANLSSDMQAVRSMNLALENHEKLYGKCATLEEAMQVIANAGYATDAWKCISKGYQVYWYKTDNRCVLYNSTTAEVEFPEKYDAGIFMSDPTNFFLYNQNYKNALGVDFSFSNGSAVKNDAGATLGSASGGKYEVELGSGGSKVELAEGALSSAATSMGKDIGDLKLFAYNQNKSSETPNFAFVKAYAAYDEKPELNSSGDVPANLYVIGTTTAADATVEQKLEAQKAAGTYVYSLLVQIAANTVDEKATIYIEPGTTLNLSAQEWCGYSVFSGYFGTGDAANPIVIDGMKLSSATSYVNTHQFAGTGSYYYMTGFFGAITGNATIENVKFTNVSIVDPACDFGATTTSSDSNCTSILGGVIGTATEKVCNVVIRNVEVTDSCSVKGVSRVGGLLAYVGGYSGGMPGGLGGTLTIENCNVACDVKTTKEGGYGSVGGIIGFINKTYNSLSGTDTTPSTPLNITIKNTTFSGDLYGSYTGGIVGFFSPSTINKTPGSVSLKIEDCKFLGSLTINPAVAYSKSGNGVGFMGQLVGAASVGGSGTDGASFTYIDSANSVNITVDSSMTSADIRTAFAGLFNPDYATAASNAYILNYIG